MNFLEDSSDGDDDEDKPTDYDLLLSTFKPLTKKPRLMEDKRDKTKDGTIRSISGGREQEFQTSSELEGEGEGERVIEERWREVGSTAEDDGCSDVGEVEDDNGEAAGKG